jgi:hypothetical protein
MRKLLLSILIVGCDFPKATSRCGSHRTENEVVYWPNTQTGSYSMTPGGFGTNMGGGIHLVTKDVCNYRIRIDTLTGKDIPGSEYDRR